MVKKHILLKFCILSVVTIATLVAIESFAAGPSLESNKQFNLRTSGDIKNPSRGKILSPSLALTLDKNQKLTDQVTYREKLYKDFQKDWQMPAGFDFRTVAKGGSDSGGGQGVYDLRTGKVRFLDILTAEELSQIVPAPFPEKLIFDKFPRCTRYTTYDLSSRKTKLSGEAHNHLVAFQNKIPLQYPTDVVTSFKLPQLRDATRIDSNYQIQAAYYENGVTYLQKQVIDQMSAKDIVGLIIKESVRSSLQNSRIRASNSEIEELTYIIFHQDFERFKKSSIFQKLKMIPDSHTLAKLTPGSIYFDSSIREKMKDSIKERLVQLSNSKLAPEEKTKYEDEISLIQFQLEYADQIIELISTGDYVGMYGIVARENFKKNILPKWMPQNLEPINGYINSKIFGWDIETGETVFGYSCAEPEKYDYWPR